MARHEDQEDEGRKRMIVEVTLRRSRKKKLAEKGDLAFTDSESKMEENKITVIGQTKREIYQLKKGKEKNESNDDTVFTTVDVYSGDIEDEDKPEESLDRPIKISIEIDFPGSRASFPFIPNDEIQEPEKLDMSEAIKADDSVGLERLIATQSNVNVNAYVSRPSSISIPLIEAAVVGSPRAMEVLLHHGADLTSVQLEGNTALHWAAARGHAECVRVLLNHGAPINPLNELECTPLMLAIQNGHTNVIDLLLARKASLHLDLNQWCDSPLTLSCYYLRESEVQMLLDQRPAGKREMYAALSRAALMGNVRVAKILIEHGADVNLKDNEIIPPLHAAIYRDQGVMVEVLIANAADVEVANRAGYRPLMEAARRGHLDIAKSLLLFGADLNAISEKDHETALSLASKAGHHRVCVLLYKYKVLPYVI